MTPTERLYKAVSNGVPDRVPVFPKIWLDLAAKLTETDFCDVISDPSLALRSMMEAGLLCGADAVRQFDTPVRRVEREKRKVFEIDKSGRRLGKLDMDGGWATHLDDPETFNIEDEYTMAFHWYWVHFNIPFIKSVDDAKRIAVPDKSFYDQIGCADRQRQVMQLAGDRIALVGDMNSATLSFHVIMRGLTTAMLDIVDDPPLVHASMEKGVAIAIERGKFLIDVGHRVLRLNDSTGTISLVSPKTWREFVYPHMKEVCDELHHYEPAVRIYCHICGNVTPVLEDLVEAGLDCIGPIDPLGDMNVADARKQVGDSVALMGGVDTLSFINKTPEEIEEEAAECITGGGQKGGYVLGSGCAIPRATTRAHLQALRRAADAHGIYKEGELVPCGIGLN